MVEDFDRDIVSVRRAHRIDRGEDGVSRPDGRVRRVVEIAPDNDDRRIDMPFAVTTHRSFARLRECGAQSRRGEAR